MFDQPTQQNDLFYVDEVKPNNMIKGANYIIGTHPNKKMLLNEVGLNYRVEEFMGFAPDGRVIFGCKKASYGFDSVSYYPLNKINLFSFVNYRTIMQNSKIRINKFKNELISKTCFTI